VQRFRLEPMRLIMISGVAVGALLTGCGHEPRSPIVEKVERAGSGDLSASSTQDMQHWLGNHRELAVQVDEMCKPVREKATAQWQRSTEGRLCNAARQLAFYRWSPAQSDGRKFSPGLK
jgi:hypothetical protein